MGANTSRIYYTSTRYNKRHITRSLTSHNMLGCLQKKERKNFNSENKDIESNLVLIDQENGIFTAHIFSIILQRLVNLHGKIKYKRTSHKKSLKN